jgi:hypothetical protein
MNGKLKTSHSHWDAGEGGRGCFNCARLRTSCNDIVIPCSMSKDGSGFWRPEGTALVTEEVEENKRVST